MHCARRAFSQRKSMISDRYPTQLLSYTKENIHLAAALLRAGDVVAFPTERVYGLGADATNPEAVAKIYAAKQRPSFNPLIVHVARLEQAKTLGIFNAAAEKLATTFWPAPLTLVVPHKVSSPICALVRANLPSIGLRIPAHPVALALLEATKIPLAAPSANRSGHVSPTTSAHVLADLERRISAVVEGGSCTVGLESTIVSCLDDQVVILRLGAITVSELSTILGYTPKIKHVYAAEVTDSIQTAGQLRAHYAPKTPLYINATSIQKHEAVLLFGEQDICGLEHAKTVLSLSETGSALEAAQNLFACLRILDQVGASKIAVAPLNEAAIQTPTNHDAGLLAALNDRLTRASNVD
jgi:L-threonylcarbamoyladenylate synthase